MAIKPKLTTFDTMMLVVSLVIGIGIFRTPAMVAAAAGTPLLFFGAWGLGCLISLAGALTFAEIGSRFPEPGAYYNVLADCYHSSVAFLCNWTNVWLVNAAGGAGVALIGAEYLCPIVLPPAWQGKTTTGIVAALLVLFLLAVNYVGIKTGAWAQNVLSLLKIAMIAAIVLAAALYRGPPLPAEAQRLMLRIAAFAIPGIPEPPPAVAPAWDAALPALWLGFISVFYSFGGYQNTINFGADVKDAKKNLPRGIILGMLIVGSLYLLINTAYFRILGVHGIAGAPLVAAVTARVGFGPAGHFVVSLAIFLSAMGFLNATLMQIPRALHAMAADRMLPPVFKKVNPRTQVQEFTLLFFGAFILLSLLVLGTFKKIVGYVIFQDSLNIAAVASTVFILRRRQRLQPQAGIFRLPFYPLLPLLFIAFLVSLSLNVFLTQTDTALIGLAVFATGLPLYFLLRALVRRRQEGVPGD